MQGWNSEPPSLFTFLKGEMHLRFRCVGETYLRLKNGTVNSRINCCPYSIYSSKLGFRFSRHQQSVIPRHYGIWVSHTRGEISMIFVVWTSLQWNPTSWAADKVEKNVYISSRLGSPASKLSVLLVFRGISLSFYETSNSIRQVDDTFSKTFSNVRITEPFQAACSKVRSTVGKTFIRGNNYRN